MNKFAVFVLLGLVAIAGASVEVEIEDYAVNSPITVINSRDNSAPGPAVPATNYPSRTPQLISTTGVNSRANRISGPAIPATNYPNRTPQPTSATGRMPGIRGGQTNAPANPAPKENNQPVRGSSNPITIINQVNVKSVDSNTNTNNRFIQRPITSISRGREILLAHFKNFTKHNTTKVFDRILPINASTTEALELFAAHIINNLKNLTQVSQILQLVAQLLLVGSQCEQDVGGALYVASIVAADVEAGMKDWQQDVIASVFAGLLTYQASGDCPPVVQIIKELIRIL